MREGPQIFSACGSSIACSTGRWAGNSAAEYVKGANEPVINREQVDREKERIYAPVKRSDKGMDWKELEAGIAKVLQDYCGDTLTEELMKIGLTHLKRSGNRKHPHFSLEIPTS